METTNTILAIIASIIAIILFIFSIIKWIIPHAKITIQISYDRTTSKVINAAMHENYADEMINNFFYGAKPTNYEIKNWYYIKIESDKNLQMEFVLAKSPSINLELQGDRKLLLNDDEKNEFILLHYGGIVMGYPNFFDERNNIKVLLKYKTWWIIPHYVLHSKKTKQSYIKPKV